MELSQDAGRYVCNHVFYVAAHLVATSSFGCSLRLVHLPGVEGESDRFRSLVRVVRGWSR